MGAPRQYVVAGLISESGVVLSGLLLFHGVFWIGWCVFTPHFLKYLRTVRKEERKKDKWVWFALFDLKVCTNNRTFLSCNRLFIKTASKKVLNKNFLKF